MPLPPLPLPTDIAPVTAKEAPPLEEVVLPSPFVMMRLPPMVLVLAASSEVTLPPGTVLDGHVARDGKGIGGPGRSYRRHRHW